MVGHLKSEAKQGLRDLAIAVATKDADRLVGAYQSLGILLPGANLDRIREAEAMMFDRFWGMSMSEMTSIDYREMRDFAHEYRDLLYEMPFQLPADLIFLGRCVAILSGMCTGLDPDFNLFRGLLPFARNILGEGDDVMEEVTDWVRKVAVLLGRFPSRFDTLMEKMERGDLAVTAKPSAALDRRLGALTKAVNRLWLGTIFIGLIISGSILYAGDETSLGLIIIGISLLPLLLSFRGRGI
jgi:predicted unusual protein kinase regulating ubiquinone biosynthesis (AarF/ABC1/UbiB family)